MIRRYFYFFLLLKLATSELICDFGKNCERLCETKVCEYNWEVNYKYSNVWTTQDYQFGEEGFPRGFPLFFNETSDRLEIPVSDTGLFKAKAIKRLHVNN